MSFNGRVEGKELESEEEDDREEDGDSLALWHGVDDDVAWFAIMNAAVCNSVSAAVATDGNSSSEESSFEPVLAAAADADEEEEDETPS